MINIAFIIDTISCDTAGTQKQLIEIIRRLDKNVFHPHLICLWEADWMKNHSLPCDCTILNYVGFLKPTIPSVIYRLATLIDKMQFHIIQTFFEDSIFVGYLGAIFCRRSPILLSSRRDMGLGSGNQPWYHNLYTLMLPLVNKRFAGIVTNSVQIKNYVAHREKIPFSKIKVIYNGIDIPSHSAVIPELIKKHPCDIWIGIVASLTQVKRHDLFLEAFAMLKQSISGSSIKALILGEGPEEVKLVRLAEQLGIMNDIIFAGAVDNVIDHIRHIHIGVLCSNREGLSNAIMEYMTCSLPVVATAVGGNVELVDSTNGICVPPDNPELLAKALQKLVENKELREQLGKESFEKLSKKYSWQKTITELQVYYRSLMRSNYKDLL